jgi:hypothetical protein
MKAELTELHLFSLTAGPHVPDWGEGEREEEGMEGVEEDEGEGAIVGISSSSFG